MAIMLAPEAAAFVKSHGGHLTLFGWTMHGCCGIGAGCVPMFELAEPKQRTGEYETEACDGVTLHLHRSLAADRRPLSIALTGRRWKRLSVAFDGDDF